MTDSACRQCTACIKDCTLKCLYINARSLLNKFDAFSATVCELEPDIIGVTESWAHSDSDSDK